MFCFWFDTFAEVCRKLLNGLFRFLKELQVQSAALEFEISLKAVSVLRYITDHADRYGALEFTWLCSSGSILSVTLRNTLQLTKGMCFFAASALSIECCAPITFLVYWFS